MKCPMCGYTPIRGRPRKINDRHVQALLKAGWSATAIANHFQVTRMTVHLSINRGKRQK